MTTAELPLTNYTSQPWYNSSTTAGLFATAVGKPSGIENMMGWGPYFSYSYSYSPDQVSSYNTLGFIQNHAVCSGGGCYGGWQMTISDGIPAYYALATVNTSVGAPEIDGSLAPKVGFLLGCLFLMFGRKKQNTEALLTA